MLVSLPMTLFLVAIAAAVAYPKPNNTIRGQENKGVKGHRMNMTRIGEGGTTSRTHVIG